MDLCANLQGAVADIRGDGRLIKDADSHLWVGWLGANLEVGITHALTHRIDTNEGTRAEEVLALQGAWTHGVLLGPDAGHVLRKELGGCQLITWVATSGCLRAGHAGWALVGR